jgi:hypothetical protein
MMVIVEQLMEWRLAGETEVLGESLPHMTRPGLQPGEPRWEAASNLCCNRNVSAAFALAYSSVVMSSTSQSSGLPPLRLILEATDTIAARKPTILWFLVFLQSLHRNAEMPQISHDHILTHLFQFDTTQCGMLSGDEWRNVVGLSGRLYCLKLQGRRICLASKKIMK